MYVNKIQKKNKSRYNYCYDHFNIQYIQIYNYAFRKKKHLELKNILTIEINVDKWYSDRTVKISNKDAMEKLQNYINSLELIELEKDYERNCPGHMYMMFLPYDTISIKGEYLSVHPNDKDDKVYTEYYIVDPGYNPITGSSKVSRFMDKLIRQYGDKISTD